MTEQWWFDLKQGRAVRDDERGPADHLLGPYPTQAAAEDWRRAHEGREQAWKAEDDRWEGDPEEGDA